MKKTLVSLAAASLIATSAFAADKGIDIVTTGQAVVYYETHDEDGVNSGDLFNQNSNPAKPMFGTEFTYGIRLNLDADLGHNFTFGSEIQYKGTSGLDGVLGNERQPINAANAGSTGINDDILLSQMFIAKKIGHTIIKAGRQQLGKGHFPFTYSEGWNVFKNSFEAFLVINHDLPKTAVIAAVIGKGNNIAPTAQRNFENLKFRTGNQGSAPKDVTHTVQGPTYMLTVENSSIDHVKLTGSFYRANKVGVAGGTAGSVDTFWGNAHIGGLPMGISVGLQGGVISPDDAVTGGNAEDTSAFGAKIAMKPTKNTFLQVAYTSVDDGSFAVLNTGTTIKSPLYTQMIFNQHNIGLDNDTVVIKGAYSLGEYGKIIAQYGMTDADDGSIEASDYDEFDLMYKLKAGGVHYFVSWMNRQWDVAKDGSHQGLLVSTGTETDNRIRVWARYNF